MERFQLSAEAGTLFQEGISLVLSRWSSLQLAVENEWGGRSSRQKALKLALDVFTWFTQTKGELYIDDLEDLLKEAMLSLNTVVDDGSIGEVAYELMCMHEECLDGNYESIQRSRESASQAKPVQHVKQEQVLSPLSHFQVENEEEEKDDDRDGDTVVDEPETIANQKPAQAPKNEPNPPNTAEDGWTVASSKKKKKKNRGRKN